MNFIFLHQRPRRLAGGIGWLLLLPCLIGSTWSAQAQSLVAHGGSWRYHKGTNAPATNWRTATDASLDATWLTGNGGFGYADGATETSLCATMLTGMRSNYTTVYLRKTFTITAPVDPTLHLSLTMDWDDGFIAWLDGNFLASANAPGSPNVPAFNAVATQSHESSLGDSARQPATTYDLGAVASRLPVGEHILSIIGLNQSLNSSSDFVLVADLSMATSLPNSVSGPIAADTTWAHTNSPITVTGDVTVQNGVTLTIEPGVRVQFNAGTGLTVDGRLLAEGQQTNHILFARTPGAAAWGGVTVRGAVGSPQTRLSYVDFSGNGSTAFHSVTGTVFLDHLTFAATDHQYVSLDGSSFLVQECVFPSATGDFEMVHGAGGIKSGGQGVFARNFFGVPSGYNDAVDFTGGNRPSPIVHFLSNVFSGSQDDGIDLDGTDAWIEGNIFLHVHRNGDTPDSAAAVSGGSNSGNTSEVTLIGNLFFDCDNATTAKQGNFFTLLNNTILHTTKTGGIDGASGAINVRDTTPSLTTFARGCYLEGNVIWDAEQLVRNYDAAETTVTLSNNIVPVAWTGPGGDNQVTNPQFVHVPTLAETDFGTWQEAQILWDWLSLAPSSPGRGIGPNGRDLGGTETLGASISGEPTGTTNSSTALLTVGILRSGNGIPTAGWPAGCGYTHYRWRLDGGPWSAETSILNPISLNGLTAGSHYVEVSGRRDTGKYQDDAGCGVAASLTRSRTWTVGGLVTPRWLSIERVGDTAVMTFNAAASQSYSVFYRDSLAPVQPWVHLRDFTAASTNRLLDVTDPNAGASQTRFYQLRSP
jgi:hypothetical protein